MSEVKITKLPPGAAEGAGDLHRWAQNRLVNGWRVVPDLKRRKRHWEKKEKREWAAFLSDLEDQERRRNELARLNERNRPKAV